MNILIFQFISLVISLVFLILFIRLTNNVSAIRWHLHKDNRVQDARINYYKHITLGQKSQAHDCLLYIIYEKLLDNSELSHADRKVVFEGLKTKYEPMFKKIGVEYPEYPF